LGNLYPLFKNYRKWVKDQFWREILGGKIFGRNNFGGKNFGGKNFGGKNFGGNY